MNELQKLLLALPPVEVLALNAYFEAAGEYKAQGEAAYSGVMAVVLNRAAHPDKYAFTIAEVVADPVDEVVAKFRQFSWTNSDAQITDPQYARALQFAREPERPWDKRWIAARDVARRLLAGAIANPVGNATYYFNPHLCHPAWAENLRLVRTIGNHEFYAAPGDPEVLWDGGSGRPQAEAVKESRPMGNFYLDVIKRDQRFGSAAEVADLELLEPVTRRAVIAIVAEAKRLGHELMVFETYRSQTRQQQLYREGRSDLAKVGVHHYGLAADLVRNANGGPSWDGDFSFLGPLAQKYGLVWGGLWKHPVDPYHVQRIAVSDQDELFAGWYPGEDYSPFSGSQTGQPVSPKIYRLTSPYMRGDKVRQIQEALGIKADGIFGPTTQSAVQAFQTAHGLAPDGIVGVQTAAKLGVSL